MSNVMTLDELQSFSKDLSGVDIHIIWNKIILTKDDPIQIAVSLNSIHPDYNILAARIQLDQIYARSCFDFVENMKMFQNQLTNTFMNDVIHFPLETGMIVHENDTLFDYAALKTLECMFLLQNEDGRIERPQHMFMRLAIHLHGRNVSKVLETYRLLSEHNYIHSSPTMMNAGKIDGQLSSCFLMATPRLRGFFQCLEKCHKILSKQGGIGFNFHALPKKCIIHCAKLLNEVTKMSSESKRASTCTVYLEPWHAGIYDFLNLKRNVGLDEMRARDLFYALWVPDLFMKRVEKDEEWSLFCPEDINVKLYKLWGDNFEEAYCKLEDEGQSIHKVKARELFRQIALTQIETGGPFIMFKDTCNRNSPYAKTIEGSNLCTEIVEYAGKDGTAVCNLASLSLPSFVKNDEFDFDLLKDVTKVSVRNLDRIIDVTMYPTECASQNNLKYRPIGLGVQGLAKVFQMLRLDFDGPQARKLNKDIFAAMRHAAEGESQGKNALLITVMPTVTTSILLSNSENCEPYTNNMFIRNTAAGAFMMINQNLVKDLVSRDMWNQNVRNHIIMNRGSVQKLDVFPERSLYKTVWEIPQTSLIEMAADRQPFIDQSQSLNIYLKTPNANELMDLLTYAFEKGLKTGMYYLRTLPASYPIQYSLEPTCTLCSN